MEGDRQNKPPRKFVFSARPSALSSVADKMWDKSKNEYSGDSKKPLVLEKKDLGDVLGKLNKQMKAEESEAAPSFVFGSKIADRVAKPEVASAEPSSSYERTSSPNEKPKTSFADNGEMSARTRAERLREESEQAAADAAKEHQRQRVSTHVVEITTGEEHDIHVYQAQCKIHSFEREKQAWTERGLCLLKINKRIEDADKDSYRIVARTTGTKKVVINSPIYSDMLLEQPDEKRIKISALSPEHPERPVIFLLSLQLSKESPASQLFTALLDAKDLSQATASGSSALSSLSLTDRKRKASECSPEELEAKKDREDEEEAEVETEAKEGEEKHDGSS